MVNMEMSQHRRTQKAAFSGPSPVKRTPVGADTDKQATFVRINRLFRIWNALPGSKKRKDLDPVVIGAELLQDHILTLFLEAGIGQRPKIHEIRYNSIDDVPLRIFAALLPLGLHQKKSCAEDLLLAVWRTAVTGVIEKDNSTDLTGEFLQFSGSTI